MHTTYKTSVEPSAARCDEIYAAECVSGCCVSAPCQNGGRCKETVTPDPGGPIGAAGGVLVTQGYECECAPGFIGVNCLDLSAGAGGLDRCGCDGSTGEGWSFTYDQCLRERREHKRRRGRRMHHNQRQVTSTQVLPTTTFQGMSLTGCVWLQHRRHRRVWKPRHTEQL